DSFRLPSTGTYTMLIAPSGAYTGSASISLFDVMASSDTIVPGGPVTVSLASPGEERVLAFSGTAGQRVSLLISDVTTRCCTDVSIRRPSDDLVVSSHWWVDANEGNDFFDTITLPSTGVYWILVNPSGSNTGRMTLT